MTGLHYRPLWLAIGYALVAATAWGSLTPVPPQWAFALGDKLLHGATYALLTFWFGQVYRGVVPQLLLVLAFSVLGVLLEVGQAFSSVYRHFDLADAAASALGAVLAWALLRTAVGDALTRLDGWLAERANARS
jgi:VanZ family protein